MTDIGDIYRLQNILVRLEMASDQLYAVPKHLLRPAEEGLLVNARNSVNDLRDRVRHRKLEMLREMEEKE